MKILFLDIEKTPPHWASYDRYDANIPMYHLIQDSFVPSVSWSWNDEELINNVSVLDDPKRWVADHTDDYHVIKTIWEQIEKADLIVGHYIKGFDWKVIAGLAVHHNLQPVEEKKCVDTLAEAKKFKYTSNKLDDLCRQFGFERKIEHRKKMMLDCSRGDYEALKECSVYNNGDIPGMRRLFYKFRPYSHTKQYPNMRKINGHLCCDRCGSLHLQKRGLSAYGDTVYGCYDCRRRMTVREKHAEA